MQRQQRSWMLRSWKGLSGIYWPLNPGRRVKTAQPVNQLRKTRQQDPRKNPQRQGRLLTVDKNFSAKIFKIDDKQAGCGFISSQFSCISAELIAHGPGLHLYLYYFRMDLTPPKRAVWEQTWMALCRFRNFSMIYLRMYLLTWQRTLVFPLHSFVCFI